MLRILYMLYLWLFVVPVFVALTILTALTVIVGCLLGGERIFAYYPGMIWSWLTCHLAGEGERTGKYRPEEIVRICCQPSRRFRHIPYIWFFGCTDQVGDESRYCQNPVCGSCLPGCRFYLCR